MLAPRCTQGYNNLGAVYFQLGRLDEARAMFDRSIEVDPEHNYVAYSNLGTINDQEARFADAALMYEKALAIEDGDSKVWGNFAYALTFGSQPEKAGEPFRRAIELAERERSSSPADPELLSRLADYYVMVGDHGTGLELLEETIRLEPEAPNVLANIGETFEDLGERDRALEWIGRALGGGILPEYFARRPMLRELIADPRYRQLVERAEDPPAGTEMAS
jgi:tetratricopeptide (TPR) repeat protein